MIWFEQESTMDAKTSGWEFDKKEDSYRVSKYLPTNYKLPINCKGKNSNLTVEKSTNITFTKWWLPVYITKLELTAME